MNNSIYDIVAKNVKQIFDEENISVIVTYETKLDRTSGIDSLNLLKLTLRIEEDLGINLDDYLNLIHSAGTVSELVSVIEKAIEDLCAPIAAAIKSVLTLIITPQSSL